ncbi:hypothetical protein Q5P01_002859 [Channa striata]|uniref:Ig-like domain-containing protein n=1 Tax=Channa striata TaxID=64152 RepID=A0AA88T457_CHASR|nr:hypothetical protein Q5P01_002859 [Channa striata]
MYHCLFLLPVLLSCCTGESLVHSPSENILAFEGGVVILPCSFNVSASNDFPTVEWSKEGLKPNVVFLYRDGCETYEMKNQAFEYRTSLIPKELKNGNISLRISNLQLSDAGRYQCMKLWRNAPRDITTVELFVGAVFEPKLSVVSVECGGVTLQCEANYSFPEPEITFLDDEGNKILAEEPRSDKDESGSFTLKRRMAFHSATNRVTCRVHQPKFNLVRHTEIHVPAGSMRSCVPTTIITIGGTILFSALVSLMGVCIWKRCGKPVETQSWPVTKKQSDHIIITHTFELQALLEPEGVVNIHCDQHQREEDSLKVESETSCSLNKKVTSQLCPVW